MAKKYETRRQRRESLAGEKMPRARLQTPRPTGDETASDTGADGRRAGRGVAIVVCLLLALGSVLVFAQTAGHQFVNCDDNEYVYENSNIQRGLTPASAWWAITNPHSANWHPLTWMSHALDWQLFGKWDAELQHYVESWPGGHHLVNATLHAICAVLLFLVLQAMTAATWPSAAVAALFAIHPLHVESVAWATGRKDTLSALFFLLTLAAYHAYAVRSFSSWRYGLVIVLFGLGLMAKPMLVTLPFVLLLLDYWPLRRIAPPGAASFSERLPARVILEKLPLLVLAAGSCKLTTWAQASVGAFKPLDFPYRLENALISYAAYLGQLFLPAGMVVQYVHKGPGLRMEDTLAPLAVLVPITLAVLWLGWRRRYLAVGWFWYVGMLVPVIGLVQVGAQARADRYTYLTQIGLYIMIAWGLRDLLRGWRGRAALYAAIGAPVFAMLTVVAWLQTTHWQNSLTLWEHSVVCQPNNDFAQNSYGDALNSAGQLDEANAHYELSFTLNPLYVTPRTNLAGNLFKQGKPREALAVCDAALEVEPDNAQVHFVRAVALYASGHKEASIAEFQETIQRNPNHLLAHANLAEVYRLSNRLEESAQECGKALAINPESAEAHRTWGSVLLAQGNLDGAIEQARKAVKLKPDDPLCRQVLADALWKKGEFRQAVEERKQEAALQGQNVTAAIKVVRDLIFDPRSEARFGAEAVEIARRACEATDGKNIFALEVLAGAYAETGDFAQAEAALRKAMETPLGQQPRNRAILQQRSEAYRRHQKPVFPLSTP